MYGSTLIFSGSLKSIIRESKIKILRTPGRILLKIIKVIDQMKPKYT